MAKEKEVKDNKVVKKEEDWMTRKWRPMMAIMYMMVCIFDFIVFPVMFTVVQFWEVEAANDAFRQWNPITLLGGGLFHVAMGAVLGVSAWSRGQEKMAGVTGGTSAPAQLPAPSGPASGMSAPASNSWGSQPLGNSSSFGSAPQMPSTAHNPAPSWGTTPVASNTWGSAPAQTGWGGKKAPPEAEYPVLG